MCKTRNFLSDEQIEKLKKLISDAHATSKSLMQLSREHPEFDYKIIKYWNMRFFPNPENIKNPEQAKKMKKLLLDAKQNGKSLADIQRANPKISIGSLQYWNRLFKVLPIRNGKIYSKELILKILNHAKEHGPCAAEKEYRKKYNIDLGQIYRWNVEYNIFPILRETKTYTEDEKIDRLNEAKKYNDKTCSRGGVKFVSEKYSIAHTVIYEWNKTYNIIPRNGNVRKTLLSDTEIDYIVEMSVNFTTVKELAKVIGRTQTTIKNVLELRGIKCDRNGIHNGR